MRAAAAVWETGADVTDMTAAAGEAGMRLEKAAGEAGVTKAERTDGAAAVMRSGRAVGEADMRKAGVTVTSSAIPTGAAMRKNGVTVMSSAIPVGAAARKSVTAADVTGNSAVTATRRTEAAAADMKAMMSAINARMRKTATAAGSERKRRSAVLPKRVT